MDLIEEKKLLYVDAIMDIAKNNPDTIEKSKTLSELLEKYYKFCYDNNIQAYDTKVSEMGFGKLSEYSYIVESEPLIFEINQEQVSSAVQHLDDALKNGGGISTEEAKLLLDWSAQKTRKVLEEQNNVNIKQASLTSYCGYAQALTLVPFQELGVKTTVNNAYKFGEYVSSHAFGTVTLPIEENGNIVNKDYLLDASYRQFFTTARCNEGRYYDLNHRCSPDCGYYLVNYLDGKGIAEQILKNGYIELTDEVLKKYGTAFIATKLNIDTKNDLVQVLNTDASTIKNTIENNQVELDFTKDELKKELKVIEFPMKSSKTK